MKAAHSIELMCRVLKVSRGGFYEWRGRAKPAARDYSMLKEAIRNHFPYIPRTPALIFGFSPLVSAQYRPVPAT